MSEIQIWWKADLHKDWPIEVRVERETEKCICIVGNLCRGKARFTRKDRGWGPRYFPTLRVALLWLLDAKAMSIENLKCRIGRQEGMLRNFEESLEAFTKRYREHLGVSDAKS